LPELDQLRTKYPGIGFLALTTDQNIGRVKQEADHLGLKMGVAIAELVAPNDFKVVPSTLVVDAQGNVIDAIEGSREQAFFEEKAAELTRH
jgi:hypothetical protein